MDDVTNDSETQTLHELLALMHEHDLERIKVRMGDAIYEIDRRQPPVAMTLPVPSMAVTPGNVEAVEPGLIASANAKKVVAPLTGVFYRAPSPDAQAYVSQGDRIEIGDVLCVLEAMKLFNEIQSDYAGTIVRILPENGELVSQGEELFWIEP
jgi:acetyl-CoA carboxylase biotin carboxyl carrier protein